MRPSPPQTRQDSISTPDPVRPNQPGRHAFVVGRLEVTSGIFPFGRRRHWGTRAALAGTLLWSGHGLALPEATSPPVEHFKLPNGLEVVIEENHREPHVAVLVSYDIGTRDEPDGYSSLAHLVEHLTFRRSRHLEDYRSFELLERAGCERIN